MDVDWARPFSVAFDPNCIHGNMSFCQGAEEKVPCSAVVSTEAVPGEAGGASV